MNKKNILFTLLYIFIVLINYSNCYGESNSNGSPNYQERESLNLINLVRMFPKEYRDNYMSNNGFTNLFTGNTYPATFPLYFNETITKLAQYHSNDMCVNGCFSHNDCNGTSITIRFDKFLNCDRNWNRAENIAAGITTGIEANNLLLCDSSKMGGPCSLDASGYDGHRKNIMSGNYGYVGVGVKNLGSSQYKTCWTQDFTSGNCGGPTTPIYSGFHSFIKKSTSPTFIMIYYEIVSPAKNVETSLVFSNGTSIKMALKYGNINQGAYIVSLPSVENCSKYYFKVVTEIKTLRYPDSGYLQLSKDLSCQSWTPSSDTSSNNGGTESENPSEEPSNSIIIRSSNLFFILIFISLLF
ncbi:hypothetical protein RB653_004397 [Dictyostelium firmibasis]|uniref:SCP domain-containing protein n=1 Tax=Dictyostelium firmibasis TaxID=79012 RepID=A0AAN7YX13_9MYCE